MQIPFTKMQGLGNDFMVVTGETLSVPQPEAIRQLADRRCGVGFDQLLWLTAPRAGGDVYYRIFNADGGEVEQCGNGARCIARFVAGPGASAGRTFRLEYPGGVVAAVLEANGDVAVEMAVPEFSPARIPFIAAAEQPLYQVDVAGQTVELAAVSMGNPHAVLTVSSVEDAPVASLGPALERHERFPNRANIGFMQIVDPRHIRLRVFERGAGETPACGTGACAAVAVGRQAGKLDENVVVSLRGGDARVRWSGPGKPVWLSGAAVRVFEGAVDL